MGSPASEYVANHDTYCGGTFRGLSGIIKSPNYPLYYPNRKHCVYDIEVPDGNDYTIKFTCDDFGVQGNQVSLQNIEITFGLQCLVQHNKHVVESHQQQFYIYSQESGCLHDYLEIWPNGMDSNTSSIKKFCGNYDNENPLVQTSGGNKMLVKFDSDRLFRYKGFHCRFRAMQSNGISVINSFVDESQGKIYCRNSLDNLNSYYQLLFNY